MFILVDIYSLMKIIEKYITHFDLSGILVHVFILVYTSDFQRKHIEGVEQISKLNKVQIPGRIKLENITVLRISNC